MQKGTVTLRASDLIAGRYRIEKPVATDAWGELWRAADLVQGHPVAVRLLPAGLAEDTTMLERFLVAARQAAAVSHPSITQVVDYGEGTAGEAPYLVTELVEAPSLAGLLAVGPLEPARAMNVLSQTASGLHAAHAAGLVRGGITPENLLVGPDGDVKITDFVIASCSQDAPVSSPAYRAPERAMGGLATPAGDLYSLGVVGYECLTGARAFRRKTAGLAAHPGRSLPPLAGSVPAGVAGLIDELTAPDPAKRPVSAERVSVRARLLRDTQAKGRDRKARDPAGRRDRRSRDVATPAPVEGHTAMLTMQLQAPLPESPRRRGRPLWPLLVAGVAAVLAAALAGWLLAQFVTAPSRHHGPVRPGTPATTRSAKSTLGGTGLHLAGQIPGLSLAAPFHVRHRQVLPPASAVASVLPSGLNATAFTALPSGSFMVAIRVAPGSVTGPVRSHR
jgi:tRNA A-37 threonylcarbamoyl transferase component Bud32